jgi:hypothetical protein
VPASPLSSRTNRFKVLLAFACEMQHIGRMPTARIKQPSRRADPVAKVAVTVRLDPVRVRQLQLAAEAENRSLTNYVETALLRDLAQRDEAARVITLLTAPGAPVDIDRDDIVRGASESDAQYAKRQDLMMELWSVPDAD